MFASHVFDRFAERAQMGIGECLSEFIVAFFHSMLICLRVNHGSDAVISYYGLGNLAMPVEERPDEFFVVTALGPNEINHLEAPGPHPADASALWPRLPSAADHQPDHRTIRRANIGRPTPAR